MGDVSPAAARAESRVRLISGVGIVLGLALRLALPFLLPLGDQVRFRLQGLNDEPAHFRYVEYVATRHALPVQRHRFEEPGAFARADFEFHQPPLYYMLGAGLYEIAGPRRARLACRLFSALCGVLTLGLAWRVLRTSPLPPLVAWPAMLFASAWLTHAYFCAVVSNDALSWLLASWVVATLWARPESKPSVGRGLALAIALGLSLLTKATLAVFLPVVAVLCLWESIRDRSFRPLLEGTAVLIVACLIASPWYLRNHAVYGSLFGLELGGGAEPYAGRIPPWAALLASTNKYFWFPMQHVAVSTASRALRAVGLALLAAHLLAAAVYLLRRRASDVREIHLAIVLALMAVAYGLRNLLWFAPEARFLLPAFVPIVYGIAAGAWTMSRMARLPSFACLDLAVLALLPFAYFGLV